MQPVECRPTNNYPNIYEIKSTTATSFDLIEIRFKIQILIGMLFSFLFFKIIQHIYRKYLKYNMFIPEVTNQTLNYKSHLFLELSNKEQKVLLYINSIGTSLINIVFHPKTQVKTIKFERNILSGSLTVEWTKGTYIVHKQKYNYASTISVPLTKLWKTHQIMKTDNNARILFLEDVFYAIEGLHNRSLANDQVIQKSQPQKQLEQKTNRPTPKCYHCHSDKHLYRTCPQMNMDIDAEYSSDPTFEEGQIPKSGPPYADPPQAYAKPHRKK
jgi:hypothetical protein